MKPLYSYWPEFVLNSMEQSDGRIRTEIVTIIRVAEKGIYYDAVVRTIHEVMFGKSLVECEREAFTIFIKQAYIAHMVQVVNTSLVDIEGWKVYTKSKDQIPEIERINKYFPKQK